jgi:hypothetical protein
MEFSARWNTALSYNILLVFHKSPGHRLERTVWLTRRVWAEVCIRQVTVISRKCARVENFMTENLCCLTLIPVLRSAVCRRSVQWLSSCTAPGWNPGITFWASEHQCRKMNTNHTSGRHSLCPTPDTENVYTRLTEYWRRVAKTSGETEIGATHGASNGGQNHQPSQLGQSRQGLGRSNYT